MDEFEKIKNIYLDRDESMAGKYNPLNPDIMMSVQEKERVIQKWIIKEKISPVKAKNLIEIGCGNGSNLLFFLKLGFQPENLVACELIERRAQIAKNMLPQAVKIIVGNAIEIELLSEQYDIVYQSLVFSSILNDKLKKELAQAMWKMVKPGGGILWYDFIYNNPMNKDVRGIKFSEVKLLFPHGRIKKWKLTLAPPVSRLITKIHPSLYSIFNFMPFLRSHILCWIKKPQKN